MPMRRVNGEFIRMNPGGYDYTCDAQYCRGRAWGNPDGSLTFTHSITEMVQEIRRRLPEKDEQETPASAETLDRGSRGAEASHHSA
jgi:hypothetical protein